MRPETLATLSAHDIDIRRGFLPSHDPLLTLPPSFDIFEDVAANLPKLLASGRVRTVLGQLPAIDVDSLETVDMLSRAMLLWSYFGHAYVWADTAPPNSVPKCIAIPWYRVASRLGRPPVLSYASHALYNWRRFDTSKPVSLENIARLLNFCGGLDEDWFVLVHIEIEAKAAPALAAIVEAQSAIKRDENADAEKQLGIICDALRDMRQTLCRMPEKCDPYIYYNRVRPYIFGWRDNPALPGGIRYEGVTAYADHPQEFRGETGAQSSIIPSIDAALGIDYPHDALGEHLLDLRNYMPPKHRLFIEFVEKGTSIRKGILKRRNRTLCNAYNACLEELRLFRLQHLEYAGRYIHSQSERSSSNPIAVGTGGTPFMYYLSLHCERLKDYRIDV